MFTITHLLILLGYQIKEVYSAVVRCDDGNPDRVSEDNVQTGSLKAKIYY
jgi:hypothetical protein